MVRGIVVLDAFALCLLKLIISSFCPLNGSTFHVVLNNVHWPLWVIPPQNGIDDEWIGIRNTHTHDEGGMWLVN